LSLAGFRPASPFPAGGPPCLWGVGRGRIQVRDQYAHPRPCLQVNPLDLVEADVSMAPVIPLRGAHRPVLELRGCNQGRAAALAIG
jgi:hypothetical protein